MRFKKEIDEKYRAARGVVREGKRGTLYCKTCDLRAGDLDDLPCDHMVAYIAREFEVAHPVGVVK